MASRTIRVLVAILTLTGASTAAGVPLLVDFTDDTWSGADGQTSFSQSYGSMGVTLSSGGGTLTFNDHEAPAGLTSDGIGVGDDEIGPNEWVHVAFSSNVTVLGYALLDLFANEGPQDANELALVELTGLGIGYWDSGTATDDVGAYFRSELNIANVSEISFLAAGGAFSDFALAGVLIDDGTPPSALSSSVVVPEPGTLALMGLGLLAFALGARGRRPLI